MSERNLQALFLAHRGEIETYINRQIGCREAAADLLQETFLRLNQQPGDCSLKNVRAYLYQIARNLVIDHFRRTARRQTDTASPEQLADLPDEAASADRVLEARQRLEILRRAMAELPERTQEIFQLNKLEGLTYFEVAHRLGISESSVQKHLARALSHAMRCLKSH